MFSYLPRVSANIPLKWAFSSYVLPPPACPPETGAALFPPQTVTCTRPQDLTKGFRQIEA